MLYFKLLPLVGIKYGLLLNKYTVLEELGVPLERYSCDHRSNTNGLRLIELCRCNDLFILNGRLFDDRTFGNYTVIDYMIGTADIYELITDFTVSETDSLFSDGHSALCLNLKVNSVVHGTSQNLSNTSNKLPWKNELASLFINNIDMQTISNLVDIIRNKPYLPATIEETASEIANIFKTSSLLTPPLEIANVAHTPSQTAAKTGSDLVLNAIKLGRIIMKQTKLQRLSI